MSTTLNAAPTGIGVRIVRPDDLEWDAARATFNTLADLRPDAIALPETAHEVAEAVAYARGQGLRVVPQSTGHNGTAVGDLTGALLVNVSRLTGVEVDAAARRVRVGAATKWEAVAPRLSDLGLAALHGSSPDVGVTGYSLGGGIGWLSRAYGMQTNAVTALELVTADGELVRASADSHADLFWALRGGGGSYGVVTSVEFEVFDVGELYAGALFFEVGETAEVLHTWTRLLPGFPDELTTWAVVLHFPPFDEVPEPFRGRSFVIVMGAFLGPEARGRALLEPLRRLGPTMDTFAMQPLSALANLAMDPESPLPYRTTTALLDELTPSAIETIAGLAAPDSALTMIQLRHGGGALGRSPEGAGARATLPGEVVMFGLGLVPDPDLEPVVGEQLATLAAAVAPATVGAYANFVEEPTDPRAFFDERTWARLQQVKAAYDPEGLFCGAHHVPAPAAV